MSYLESNVFGAAEGEYLWAPYSVFTVRAVKRAARNSYWQPHVVTVAAALDARREPEDLPLAPWF